MIIKYLFQNNEIPFYVICKKFVNFYKIFLQGKKQDIREKKNKNSSSVITLDDLSSNDEDSEKGKEKENPLKNSKNLEVEKQVHDNIEINENIELEYEIRLPQFLIDYSDSTNKRLIKLAEQNKAIANGTLNATAANANNEEEGDNNSNDSSIDEFGESDLLVDDNDRKNAKEEGGYTSRFYESKNEVSKISRNISNINKDNSNFSPGNESNYKRESNLIKSDKNETPTPNGVTPTPNGNTPNNNYLRSNNDFNNNGDSSKINQTNANLDFNKKSDEEKDFILKVKQYKELFAKGNLMN